MNREKNTTNKKYNADQIKLKNVSLIKTSSALLTTMLKRKVPTPIYRYAVIVPITRIMEQYL